MSQRTTFDAALDAVEQLPADEQAELVKVVRRRLVEQGRQRIIADVREAREEYAGGRGRMADVDALLREIES